MALTTVDAGLLSSQSQQTWRNRIINGAMVIDQRNAGASVSNGSGATANYPIDRFGLYGSQASKLTGQQNAGSITPPSGFTKYVGITSSSAYSVPSTEAFYFFQWIEGFNIADLGWGASGASSVTLSFWVRSSLTGTFGGSLQNGNQNYSYPFSYTISSANTWTQVSISIAGPTSGTWATDNTGGIRIFWSMGMGSTLQGTAGAWTGSNYRSVTGETQIVANNASTWQVTGVQLEKGSTATSFDYRPYSTELALCMRYCVNYNSATASSVYYRYGIGEVESSTNGSQILQFPVPMRTGPTLTTTGTASNYTVYSAGSLFTCTSVPSVGVTSPLTTNITWTTTGLTIGRACALASNNNNTSYLILSAEL